MIEILVGMTLTAALLLVAGGLVTENLPTASVGIATLAAAVGFEYVEGRMTLLGVVLLAAGLAALFVELVVPSGFFGAAGALALAGALLFGWSPSVWVFVPLLVGLMAGAYLALRSGQLKGLTDPGNLPSGVPDGPPLVAGQEGVALSRLVPSGRARFSTADGGDHDVEVTLRSGSAEAGAPVRVVAVRGMDILVDLAE